MSWMRRRRKALRSRGLAAMAAQPSRVHCSGGFSAKSAERPTMGGRKPMFCIWRSRAGVVEHGHVKIQNNQVVGRFPSGHGRERDADARRLRRRWRRPPTRAGTGEILIDEQPDVGIVLGQEHVGFETDSRRGSGGGRRRDGKHARSREPGKGGIPRRRARPGPGGEAKARRCRPRREGSAR